MFQTILTAFGERFFDLQHFAILLCTLTIAASLWKLFFGLPMGWIGR